MTQLCSVWRAISIAQSSMAFRGTCQCSTRLKVKLTVQKEVMNGAVLQEVRKRL